MANEELFKRASSLKVKPTAHNGLSVGSSPTLPTSFSDTTEDLSRVEKEKPKLKDVILLFVINPIAVIALAGVVLYHFFG